MNSMSKNAHTSKCAFFRQSNYTFNKSSCAPRYYDCISPITDGYPYTPKTYIYSFFLSLSLQTEWKNDAVYFPSFEIEFLRLEFRIKDIFFKWNKLKVEKAMVIPISFALCVCIYMQYTMHGRIFLTRSTCYMCHFSRLLEKPKLCKIFHALLSTFPNVKYFFIFALLNHNLKIIKKKEIARILRCRNAKFVEHQQQQYQK